MKQDTEKVTQDTEKWHYPFDVPGAGAAPALYPLPKRGTPVTEERLDRSRVLIRCSDLAGGCGESLELIVHKRAGNGKARLPKDYMAFYRYHGGCKVTTAAVKRRGAA